MVAMVDISVLRDLVTKLAPNDRLLADAVKEAHGEQAAQLSRPPILHENSLRSGSVALPDLDFDRYSKLVWHALNDRDILIVSGSHRFDRVGDIGDCIWSCIHGIDQNTDYRCPPSTRQSVVENLLKIAMMMLLTEDPVGREVWRTANFYDEILYNIIKTLKTMTGEEMMETGKRSDNEGTLISKAELVWKLWNEGKMYEYCRSLKWALKVMRTGNPFYPDEDSS